ncbi:hypothetical protein CHS0354_027189 [Potamilus streckersoni]|uniref:Uncharacterized protein n=1 Tax=Potamilus streckersoni TaxID=2493646 RepID=A0AAE0T245_9BIVA|nr:hypothetical protein CHS0354_027189 [Potamilus streckersoni]
MTSTTRLVTYLFSLPLTIQRDSTHFYSPTQIHTDQPPPQIINTHTILPLLSNHLQSHIVTNTLKRIIHSEVRWPSPYTEQDGEKNKYKTNGSHWIKCKMYTLVPENYCLRKTELFRFTADWVKDFIEKVCDYVVKDSTDWVKYYTDWVKNSNN